MLRLFASWTALALVLTFAGSACAQAVSDANPRLADNSQDRATACNPACATNQVCASNGQCMQLVAVAVNANEERPEPPPATRRNSTPMMVGGIVLAGVGGLVALTGLMYAALGSIGCPDTNSSGPSACNDELKNIRTIGLVMGIGGTVMAVAGIPLIVIGTERVPNKDPETAILRTVPPIPRAELIASPTGLSLIGRF